MAININGLSVRFILEAVPLVINGMSENILAALGICSVTHFFITLYVVSGIVKAYTFILKCEEGVATLN